jgi:putative Ca2+/H+ antiporter (TMEM165/GDT1 family)
MGVFEHDNRRVVCLYNTCFCFCKGYVIFKCHHFQYDKQTANTLLQDPETGVIIRKHTKTSAFVLISRIYLQAFTLTFLAEWGDRSQLTTIILAAREVSCNNNFIAMIVFLHTFDNI